MKKVSTILSWICLKGSLSYAMKQMTKNRFYTWKFWIHHESYSIMTFWRIFDCFGWYQNHVIDYTVFFIPWHFFAFCLLQNHRHNYHHMCSESRYASWLCEVGIFCLSIATANIACSKAISPFWYDSIVAVFVVQSFVFLE